ncbi:stalk domain-containing protein [Paenibacillus sp. B01]|uniref:stalk domain-containing protein n=1 Tax=Paenibacillus sp. B01 TaxID=2660554 RepID=UPI00129B6401|nr:stalk domain-containing protein [Paenibacillus sp. B01]QGG54449.1 hypothetical protein GE073_01735 [Paenibacillus sp. B01]
MPMMPRLCLPPARKLLLAGASALLLAAACPLHPSLPVASAAQALADGSKPSSLGFELKIEPIWLSGQMMLPAKAFAKGAGASLAFSKGAITLKKGTIQVSGAVGSPKAVANGQSVRLPYSPKLIQGALYIPVLMAAKTLGMDQSAYEKAAGKLTFSYSPYQAMEFEERMFHAARDGDAATVKEMLRRGVDPLARGHGYGDSTALDVAIRLARMDAVEALLAAGSTFDPQLAADFLEPSQRAGKNGLLRLLLEHGLDPNTIEPVSGRSLLEIASSGGAYTVNGKDVFFEIEPELVRLLLQHGADPNVGSPLAEAVLGRSFEATQLLLASGADPERSVENRGSAAGIARMQGLSKWLRPSQAKPAIPELSFLDDQGNALIYGSYLLGLDAQPELLPLYWNGPAAYVDRADGTYQLRNVTSGPAAWLLSDHTIALSAGKAAPSQLRLPAFNVSVSVEAERADVWSGFGELYDSQGSRLLSLSVYYGKCRLHLPPGRYDLVAFGSAGPYGGNERKVASIVVPADGSAVQAVAVTK